MKPESRPGLSRSASVLGVLAMLVIAAVAAGVYMTSQPRGGSDSAPSIQVFGAPLPSITTTLNLTVRHPDGTVVTRVVHGDLITDNFNKWLTGMLTNYGGSAVTNSLTNVAGTAETVIYSASSGNVFNAGPTFGAVSGGQIYIGTSTKTVARSVTSLQTTYGSPINVITSTCNNAAPPTVVAQGSTNAGSGGTITEAGFAVVMEAPGTAYPFLFTYETFVGVTVSSGDVISAQYTFTLNNNGVNRNLCNALAAFFLATSNPTLWTAYDTSGTSWSMCGWSIGTGCGAPQHWLQFQTGVVNGVGQTVTAEGICTNNMAIWPGTSATTYGFTTNTIGGPIGSNPVTLSSTTYTSGLQTSYVFATENTFNPASTSTVTELALFTCEQANTGGGLSNTRFLLFGLSFSGVTATTGQTNPFSIQISD